MVIWGQMVVASVLVRARESDRPVWGCVWWQLTYHAVGLYPAETTLSGISPTI